jgi:hypothetical protein
MGRNGVIGIIIPLGHEAVHNIVHRKNLYVGEKDFDWSSFSMGDRVFLYESDESKLLEGEAKIRGISFQKRDELLENLDRLCLAEQEVRERLDRAAGGEIPIIEVEEAVKYSSGVVCPFEVPRGGLRVTDETFSEILRANGLGT